MKLDKILQDTLKIKFNPRKPLFYTRVKFYLWSDSGQWIQNCRGLLVLYTLKNCYYFSILNITKFQVDFDLEIYSNFLKFAKFIGENRSMQFLLPCQSQNLIGMMILQSKQQLTQLKRKLQNQFYKQTNIQQLQFFKRPQVQQILKQADITQQALQTHMKLRNEVQAEIKQYFNDIDALEKKKQNSGFKAYGLGRQQWKLQQNQKQYLKEKTKSDLISHLSKINKQNKML